jgi:hypothetical protein
VWGPSEFTVNQNLRIIFLSFPVFVCGPLPSNGKEMSEMVIPQAVRPLSLSQNYVFFQFNFKYLQERGESTRIHQGRETFVLIKVNCERNKVVRRENPHPLHR